MERANGIEPLSQPWLGRVLILNYARATMSRPDNHYSLTHLSCGDNKIDQNATGGNRRAGTTFLAEHVDSGHLIRGGTGSSNAPGPGTHLVRFRL